MKLGISADNHLRPDLPLCRMDSDFIATQRNVLAFSVNECNKRNAHFVIAGDLFDVPRVTPSIVNMFLDEIMKLKNKCFVIAGNHSLPWHKQENLADSSIGAIASLTTSESVFQYLPCDEMNDDGRFEHSAELTKDILLVHTLTFPSKDDIPYGAKAVSAYQLLDKYPQYKWIITGDYHHHFVVKDKDRYVINPGCTTIQTADMLDYEPGMYYIDTDKEEIEWIKLPNDISVLTDSHLKDKKERDGRIDSFIETVKKNGKMTLSFDDNLEKALMGIDPDIITIFDELKEELHE